MLQRDKGTQKPPFAGTESTHFLHCSGRLLYRSFILFKSLEYQYFRVANQFAFFTTGF